jgi:NAD(P)-dependent dehydrogenase (short-subunit alcohol dehydrogenase family)
VTGAARGIGAETAKALAARGARVALVGLEADRLAEVTADIVRTGAQAAWFEADVADARAVAHAVAGVVEHFGGVDVVLSNAGIGAFGTLETMDPRQFERVMAVNFTGTWNVVRATLPHLLARRGYFLAVASLAAAGALPGMGAYAASKAATEALCDTLRQEVAYRGVDVGVAYFGWVGTELVSTAESHPAFLYMRQRLPKLVRDVSPVSLAVDALVDGIERRRMRVVAPRRLQLVLGLRWAAAPQAARASVRFMAKVDAMCADALAQYGGADKLPTTDPKAAGKA